MDNNLRVSFVGHATTFVERGEQCILCDPHLRESYAGSLFTYYPPRTVDTAAMPKPTLVFISHRHRDHFDVASLQRLDRGVPVLCPDDLEVVYALDRMGFQDINPIKDWQEIAVGAFRLIFTPSRYRVPEHGLLMITPDAVAWNLVDTVIDAEIVVQVRRVLGGRPLDLLLWPYQPLQETNATESLGLDFPASYYESDLSVLRALAPRAVVPYSDGQIGHGPTAWLNHYRFPVSYPEVEQAVRAMLPATRVVEHIPGTALVLRGGEIAEIERVPWVHRLALDGSERTFDSTQPVTDLDDPLVWRALPPRMPLAVAVEALGERLARFLRNERLSPFREAAERHGVRYDIVIGLPEGASTVLRWMPPSHGFEAPNDAFETVTRSHCVLRIPLPVLERLLDGRMHFVAAYLGGLFRTWEALYVVSPNHIRPLGVYRDSSEPLLARECVLSPGMFLRALLAEDGSLWQRNIDAEVFEALHAAR